MFAVPLPVSPMASTLVRPPLHREGWVYEEKVDGIRARTRLAGLAATAPLSEKENRETQSEEDSCRRFRNLLGYLETHRIDVELGATAR